MRPFAVLAALLAVLVVINEVQWIGRTSLWLPFMLLASAIIILAYAQMRHG